MSPQVTGLYNWGAPIPGAKVITIRDPIVKQQRKRKRVRSADAKKRRRRQKVKNKGKRPAAESTS